MTVGQLLSNTSSAELSEWRAFYQVRREFQKEANELAALEREALAGVDELRAQVRS
jgi:hypothetical protein